MAQIIKTLLFWTVIFSLYTSAKAEEIDECILPLDVLLTTVFDETKKYQDIETLHFEKENRRVHHDILTPDGKRARYESGGCVDHFKSLKVILNSELPGEIITPEIWAIIKREISVLPLTENFKTELLSDIEYTKSNQESVALEAQANAFDESGKMISITIESSNSFSIVSNFPL